MSLLSLIPFLHAVASGINSIQFIKALSLCSAPV